MQRRTPLPRVDPDHDRDRPPGPERRRRADEAGADPHRVLAGHLRGARLRGRALRPRHRACSRRRRACRTFMGTMSFCVEAAVEAVGGEDALEPGDIILYNVPYGTGSHPQDVGDGDAGLPAGGELIGYSAIKAHWLDIGGKDPYSTDTVDVFQEGTIFPGVKLYARGRLVEDIYRMAVANSRVPKMVAGDINADGRRRAHRRRGARARSSSATALATLPRVRRRACTTHGEAVVRAWFEQLPDGRYVGHGEMDSQRRRRTSPSRSRSSSRSSGSTVPRRLHRRPAAAAGPDQLPAALDRLGQPDRDHHAGRRRRGARTRATSARSRWSRGPARSSTREPPAPCFLYGWAGDQAIEVDLPGGRRGAARGRARLQRRRHLRARLVGRAARAPASRGPTARPHPVGQGAHAGGDGASSLMHVSEAATRITPVEVWEAKNPWLIERVELAPDSCGAGPAPRRARRRHRLPHARGRLAHRRRSSAPRTPRGGWRRGRGAPEQRVARDARRHASRGLGKATRRWCPRGADRPPAHRRWRRLRRRRPSATRRRSTPTCATATSARSTRARHYPHAFEDPGERDRRLEIADVPALAAAARFSARVAAARPTPAR